MKKTDIKTITYDVEFRNFMVDVVETDFGFEAYIYKNDHGIKSLMFGIGEKDINKFMEFVEANLLEYMSKYEDDYMIIVTNKAKY